MNPLYEVLQGGEEEITPGTKMIVLIKEQEDKNISQYQLTIMNSCYKEDQLDFVKNSLIQEDKLDISFLPPIDSEF